MKINNLKLISKHFWENHNSELLEFDAPVLFEHGFENEGNINISRIYYGHKYIRLGACWHDKIDNYHELYEEKRDISTWPTANMELLVAYFDKDSSLHPYPNNLIVYNADGSIRHIVPPPVLAKQPDRRKVLKGYPNGMGTPMDPKHQEQNLIEVVYFSKDYEVKETSLLDPYSGKLVEVLKSEEISYDRLIRGG